MLTIESDKILLQTEKEKEYLPGIVQSITIGGSIIYEKQNTDGEIKRKITLGYDDKTISISLKLFPNNINGEENDVYNQLAKLEKLFKKSDKSVPQVYTFVHPQTKARGISKVLFQRLESSQSVNSNIIDVTLEFVEFIPAEVLTKDEVQKKLSNTKNSTQNTKANETTKKETQKTPVEEQEPKIEWKKYFEAGKSKWK